MSERPFMQLYVSDFIGDTLSLSTEQIGAYMLLLMAMWNAGGKLPADDAKLARIVRMSVKKWRAIAGDLMTYFEAGGDHISHNRLTKELRKSESKSESRASAGAVGGAAKALKDKEAAVAIATVLPQHLPDTISQKEIPPSPLSGGDDEFSQKVWEVFPRHLNSTRSDAEDEWQKLSAADQRDCVSGVAAYRVEHDRAEGQGRRPIPKKLSTWISKRGWEGLAQPASGGELVIVAPDSPDFSLICDHLGNRLVLSKSGNATVRAEDLAAARSAHQAAA